MPAARRFGNGCANEFIPLKVDDSGTRSHSGLPTWQVSTRGQRAATAKTQVIVGVAVRVHDSRAVPEGGTPAAPVLVCVIGVEYEPAALHLRIPESRAATTGHLIGR